MADIELVIKIPDYYLENIKKNLPIYLAEEHITKILPKGHGRLIDADALQEDCLWWETDLEVSKAPTIIEADEESEG